MFSSKKNFFSSQKPSSFFCMNGAQFLGALNDNIYKLLTIFLLISTLGVEHSSSILAAVGALYVLPFLLLSAAAGTLADRFSKQKMIVKLKIAEMVLMLLSLLVFYLKSAWGCYLLLFLIAAHSSVFGPSKYGIIPELVEKQKIPKANSLVTSFTYLAVIIGTFLASFLTDVTHQNYVLSVLFCLVFAAAGFVFSLGIEKTPPQRSFKKVDPLFLREIIRTLIECRKTPFLLPSIFGSAFFLLIGAFTQLNIIPFAMTSLHLSEVAGGYLFLCAALGIAIGSFLAGKILKNAPELGLSCLAGFVISVLLLFLWIFSSFLVPTILCLTLLGLFGGVFVVSFDSFTQASSANEKRGQTIAAANFLSFFGVLVSSFFLYLFGKMNFSPAGSFLCMSFLTFVSTVVLTLRLFPTALPFLSRFFSYKTPEANPIDPPSIFLSNTFTWGLLWKAARFSSLCKIVFVTAENRKAPWLLRLVASAEILPPNLSLVEALKHSKTLLSEGASIYLFHSKAFEMNALPRKKSLFSFSEETVYLISFDELEGEKKMNLEKHLLP